MNMKRKDMGLFGFSIAVLTINSIIWGAESFKNAGMNFPSALWYALGIILFIFAVILIIYSGKILCNLKKYPIE